MRVIWFVFLYADYLNALNKMVFKAQINKAFGTDEGRALWTLPVHDIKRMFVLWLHQLIFQNYSKRPTNSSKSQWSLYVPPGLPFTNSTFCPHSVFMCFVWISEQTAIISLYSINWLVFIAETECVYCAVRTGSLYIILRSAHRVYLCVLCGSQNKQRLFPYTELTDWFL